MRRVLRDAEVTVLRLVVLADGEDPLLNVGVDFLGGIYPAAFLVYLCLEPILSEDVATCVVELNDDPVLCRV